MRNVSSGQRMEGYTTRQQQTEDNEGCSLTETRKQRIRLNNTQIPGKKSYPRNEGTKRMGFVENQTKKGNTYGESWQYNKR